MLPINSRKYKKPNYRELISNTHMFTARLGIPEHSIKVSQLFPNNQIMAVRFQKGQLENSRFPDKWGEARIKEMDPLRRFVAFELVHREEIPQDHPSPTDCRLLYASKDYPYDVYQKDNPKAESIARYKARLISQGLCEEVDDTYAPTPTVESA